MSETSTPTAPTANATIYNPHNYDVLTANVTIDSVEYIVKSWSTSAADSAVDSQNTDGSYRGSFYVKGKLTASVSIQLIAATDKVPDRWKSFTYEGKTWVIQGKPQVSKSSGAETQYSFTADEYVSAS